MFHGLIYKQDTVQLIIYLFINLSLRNSLVSYSICADLQIAFERTNISSYSIKYRHNSAQEDTILHTQPIVIANTYKIYWE
jgi:hypothetical protein